MSQVCPGLKRLCEACLSLYAVGVAGEILFIFVGQVQTLIQSQTQWAICWPDAHTHTAYTQILHWTSLSVLLTIISRGQRSTKDNILYCLNNFCNIQQTFHSMKWTLSLSSVQKVKPADVSGTLGTADHSSQIKKKKDLFEGSMMVLLTDNCVLWTQVGSSLYSLSLSVLNV